MVGRSGVWLSKNENDNDTRLRRPPVAILLGVLARTRYATRSGWLHCLVAAV
jgi:hypothetical protein